MGRQVVPTGVAAVQGPYVPKGGVVGPGNERVPLNSLAWLPTRTRPFVSASSYQALTRTSAPKLPFLYSRSVISFKRRGETIALVVVQVAVAGRLVAGQAVLRAGKRAGETAASDRTGR